MFALPIKRRASRCLESVRAFPLPLLLLSLACTACAGEPPPPAPPIIRSCSLSAAISELVPSTTKNCGTLRVNPATSDLDNARACTQTAIAEGTSFTVSWHIAGGDSFIENAIVGRASASGLELFDIGYDSCPMGCGAGDPHTRTFRCTHLLEVRPLCENRDKAIGHEVSLSYLEDFCPSLQLESHPLGLTGELYCEGRKEYSRCP